MPETAHISKPETPSAEPKADRARLAYAFILWQMSLPKPSLDVQEREKELKDAVGREIFKLLEELPETEKESLRFHAEKEYAHSRSLEEDWQTVMKQVLGPRRHSEMYEKLSKVEKGDDTQ